MTLSADHRAVDGATAAEFLRTLKAHAGRAGDDAGIIRVERVGLAPASQFTSKYPGDLSGGQKQRVALARAIILEPDVLIADEPISMLDMSVRAKILELMLELKDELDLTYVYITHDLATAKFFCDRIAIMYLGRIVEQGPAEEIYSDPKHPYTQALLRAIPDPDPTRTVPRDLPRGEVPDAVQPPLGCNFHPRCPKAFEVCGWESRDLRALLQTRWTKLSEAEFEEERELVGDLNELDVPATEAILEPGAEASPEDAGSMISRLRAQDPDDPFWKGVEDDERLRRRRARPLPPSGRAANASRSGGDRRVPPSRPRGDRGGRAHTLSGRLGQPGFRRRRRRQPSLRRARPATPARRDRPRPHRPRRRYASAARTTRGRDGPRAPLAPADCHELAPR